MKRFHIFLSVFMTFSAALNAQLPTPSLSGDVKQISVPEDCDISPVHNGLIKVTDLSTLSCGFVNLKGEYVYPVKFYCENNVDSEFSGGCVVREQNGRWAVLDTLGHVAELPAECKYVTDFVDGVALVWNEVREHNKAKVTIYFVNDKGEKVFPNFEQSVVGPSYREFVKPGKLNEQRRAYYDFNAKLWGYMNDKGEVVIKPRFANALAFNEGMAAVLDANTKLWGFINRQGEQVIPPTYKAFPGQFSEGFCPVLLEDNRTTAYIDKTGKIVNQNFVNGSGFCYGYAIVGKREGLGIRYITVDKDFSERLTLDGVMAFPTDSKNLTRGHQFSDGMTIIQGKIYSSSGAVAIQGNEMDDEFKPFSEQGLAFCKTKIGGAEKIGFINREAKFVVVFNKDGKHSK